MSESSPPPAPAAEPAIDSQELQAIHAKMQRGEDVSADDVRKILEHPSGRYLDAPADVAGEALLQIAQDIGLEDTEVCAEHIAKLLAQRRVKGDSDIDVGRVYSAMSVEWISVMMRQLPQDVLRAMIPVLQKELAKATKSANSRSLAAHQNMNVHRRQHGEKECDYEDRKYLSTRETFILNLIYGINEATVPLSDNYRVDLKDFRPLEEIWEIFREIRARTAGLYQKAYNAEIETLDLTIEEIPQDMAQAVLSKVTENANKKLLDAISRHENAYPNVTSEKTAITKIEGHLKAGQIEELTPAEAARVLESPYGDKSLLNERELQSALSEILGRDEATTVADGEEPDQATFYTRASRFVEICKNGVSGVHGPRFALAWMRGLACALDEASLKEAKAMLTDDTDEISVDEQCNLNAEANLSHARGYGLRKYQRTGGENAPVSSPISAAVQYALAKKQAA
jgi:hypothetical protein